MIGKKKPQEDPQNLIVRKEYKKAIDIYRERLKEQPQNANLRLALADALLSNSQVAEALREYKELAAKFTEDHFILKAVAIYKKMLKIRPDMKDVEKLLAALSDGRDVTEAPSPGEPEVFELIDSDSESPEPETQEQPGLFKDLSAEEFKQIVTRLSLRHFDRDALVMKEGDPGDSLFIIVRGSVRVTTKGPRQKEDSHGCLDATADDDQVIDKGISGPAPSVHLLTQALLLCRRHGLNDEDLEVGPAEWIMLRAAENQILAVVAMLTLGDFIEGTEAVGLRDKRAIDPSHQPCQAFPSSGGRKLLDNAEGRMARERPKLLQRRQCRALRVHSIGHALIDRLYPSQRGDDTPSRLLQPRPRICPELPPAVVRVRAGLIDHDQLLELRPRTTF